MRDRVIALILLIVLFVPSCIKIFLYYKKYGIDDGNIFIDGFYTLLCTVGIIFFFSVSYVILLKVLLSVF